MEQMATTCISFAEYLKGKYDVNASELSKERLALYVDEYFDFCNNTGRIAEDVRYLKIFITIGKMATYEKVERLRQRLKEAENYKEIEDLKKRIYVARMFE